VISALFPAARRSRQIAITVVSLALLVIGLSSTNDVADAAARATLSASPTSTSAAPLVVTAGPGGQASVVIKNTDSTKSTSALKVQLASSDPAFQVDSTCIAVALGPGKSCSVVVRYSAAAPTQDSTASVTVSSKKPGIAASATAYFKIVGIAPVAVLTPAAGLGFGETLVGQASAEQTVTLSNTGSGTLHISQIGTGGSDLDDFQVTVSTCGQALAPNDSCTIALTFSPTAEGARSATFEVTDDAAGSPQTVPLSGTGTVATVPDAPLIGTATRGNATATVNWAAPASDGGSPITGYAVTVFDAATDTQVGAPLPAGAAVTSLGVSDLTNGTGYYFVVTAQNSVGDSLPSAPSNIVTPATVPDAPLNVTALARNGFVAVAWTPPADDGGSAMTGYEVKVVNAVTNAQVGALRPAAAGATSLAVTGLTNGTAYYFVVRAVNGVGAGPFSAHSNTVTAATAPDPPVIGAAVSGAAGGALTATATWTAPADDGGSPITGYQVTAIESTSGNTVTSSASAASRSLVMSLPAGTYQFVVAAINAVGTSAPSERSNEVAVR
jgi:predicted phage tail protein